VQSSSSGCPIQLFALANTCFEYFAIISCLANYSAVGAAGAAGAGAGAGAGVGTRTGFSIGIVLVVLVVVSVLRSTTVEDPLLKAKMP
jgi:hypothetical protein